MVDSIEPKMPAVSAEIIAGIGREVSEYARPLEGSFGRGLRRGVEEALDQFVAMIRDPDAGRGSGREVYVELGRGEFRQGRSLDSLQRAYRVGARIAWRHLAEACIEDGFDARVVGDLAEAIFAYIDELSAESVEGYAEAVGAETAKRHRRRRELARALLRAPAVEPEALEAAAAAAGWPLPVTVAALVGEPDAVEAAARSASVDLLVQAGDEGSWAAMPDPQGPGRRAELEAARALLFVGHAVPPADLRQSLELARLARRAAEEGVIEAAGAVLAEEHLGDLLLVRGRQLLELVTRRRLAALQELSPKAAERMRATALAYVEAGGNATAMAEALGVHPQTVRYRLGSLRELLGGQLEDPAARFEIEAALRLGRAGPPGSG